MPLSTESHFIYLFAHLLDTSSLGRAPRRMLCTDLCVCTPRDRPRRPPRGGICDADGMSLYSRGFCYKVQTARAETLASGKRLRQVRFLYKKGRVVDVVELLKIQRSRRSRVIIPKYSKE